MLGQFLWNEANHLLQKSSTKRSDVLLSNDTAVTTDVDQRFVGDHVPGLLYGLLLPEESGAVQAVEVSLEGSNGAHIERGDEKSGLGGEEEEIEHPLARGEEKGLDVATDLGSSVGGESVHHKKGGLDDVLRNMIDVELHARDVHAFHGILAPLTPPATCLGSVLVGVGDEEGWDVNTISSDRQCHGVSKPIALLFHHWIVPEVECQHAEIEWKKCIGRDMRGEMGVRRLTGVWGGLEENRLKMMIEG